MKRACPYCGRIHDRRNACGRAPVYRKDPYSAASELRGRNVWKKVKRLANERDGFLCVFCLHEGVLNYEELETHHIIPIEVDPERAYDLDNLVTLCRRHHEEAEKLPPGEVRARIGAPLNPRCPAEEETFRKPGD